MFPPLFFSHYEKYGWNIVCPPIHALGGKVTEKGAESLDPPLSYYLFINLSYYLKIELSFYCMSVKATYCVIIGLPGKVFETLSGTHCEWPRLRRH